MTDTTSSSAAAAAHKKPRSLFPVVVVLLVVIAGLLLWHYAYFEGKKKVAIVTSGDGPYWDLVIAGAREAARQYNVDLTIERCKSDVHVQSETIKRLLAGGYDGIAISPLSPVQQTVLLGQVATTTTLLTFDSDVPVSRRLCFVGTDNYAAGRACGEEVRRALPDGGEIIIALGNPEKDNTQRRRQGLIDGLLERPYDPHHLPDPLNAKLTGDQYTIVATLVDGSDTDKAAELAAQALKDHPNVKCYVGLLSYSAPAILRAVEQAGAGDRVQIIGFDASTETLEAIEGGRIRASIIQDQYGCGYHAVRILADNAHGNFGGLPMFQTHLLAIDVVTRENLAEARQRLQAQTPAAQPRQ